MSFGTGYACPYDGSKAFTVSVFRARGNSNFSTTDYCTVQFAPTGAKLAVLLLFKTKGQGSNFSQHTPSTWLLIVYNQGIRNYYLETLQFCIDLVQAQQNNSNTTAAVALKQACGQKRQYPPQIQRPLRITTELCAGYQGCNYSRIPLDSFV